MRNLTLILTLTLLALLTMQASTPVKAVSPVLIANPDVSVNRLSTARLRAIFSLRVDTWPDGTRIRVVTFPDDDPHHLAFTKGILHLYPHQLRRRWDRIVHSGRGTSPAQVTSVEQMRALVSETPGAVGYLPSIPPQGPEVKWIQTE